MEKRIELERRGRDPAKITELNLDNCKSTSVVGLSEEFENLETLSLINVGLTSLKGFPALPNLRKLELSDNRISGGLSALTCLPKLSYLNLSGNKIKDLETLEALKDLKSLVNLDLFNCEVSQMENYREKMFSLIPSLVFLDGFDKEDNSEDEEDGEEEEDGVDALEGDPEQDDEDIDGEEEEEIDEEEVEEEEDEDEDEEDVPLDALYKEYNPIGDDDYEAADGEEEEDDILEEEEEEGEENRGQKRKLEESED